VKAGVIAICVCGMVYSFANAGRPISHLCVTDMTTGFRVDGNTGKWRITNFKERKYIVNQTKPDAVAWYVRQIGSAEPTALCRSTAQADRDTLRCSGSEEFWMDTMSLRFTVVYPHGYWDTARAGATPTSQNGKSGTPIHRDW
jgi:hypothetical protein